MKTILVTGATDGIGQETARHLIEQGHKVLLHGRSAEKLKRVAQRLSQPDARPHCYIADLSRLEEVEAMASAIREDHEHLSVLINNAGVLRAPVTTAPNGMDLRYVVNVVAPYLLTQRLRPLMDASGRVVNLSSAAQSTINERVMRGERAASDMEAYAQSKLALTMWSCHLGRTLGADAPVFVAVNPGSMLGTKMVQDAFGVQGGDVGVGAAILVRAATGDDFADARGRYYDNDSKRFAPPHPDALNGQKCAALVAQLEDMTSASH